MEDLRVDKYIWAIRLFKTRSLSAAEIKAGNVLINEEPVKPSQSIKEGDIIKVKRNPIWRSYKVKELLKRRVGAKLVAQYIEEVTPSEEIEKLEMMKMMPGFDRRKGEGRPTKRERRDLDKYRW
ncbi:MAG: RNA-binding S4 domain-containing protein [Flavobacteriales bacterium]|nr:RNA-binding S4 domain-containing protein [Flavobacteriales bacterium]